MEESLPTHSLPRIKLNRYEIRRIRSGHPWIYQKSIDEQPENLETGDAVTVVGPKGEPIGTAMFNKVSKIRLRMVDRKIDTALDETFFEEHIRKALAYRKLMYPSRNSFRLINSESDGLSGLIVDCYDDATLFQITSAGFEQRKNLIINALKSILNPKILIERSDVGNRKHEGLEQVRKTHLDGGLDPESLKQFPVTISETQYELNFEDGNKTGLYLDQIDNHIRFKTFLGHYCEAKVLDCFSYVGGFSLAAASSPNVQSVIGIDQSAECIEKAKQHAKINGLEEKCTFEKANVFDWLRKACDDDTQRESYDIVILDPPSFTKSRYTVEGALRGYKELHVRALKLLKPGGSLVTYSCSHHISEDLLRSIVFEAANDTRVELVEIENHRQSLDHPIVPSIPETFYLKGYIYLKR